MDENEEVENLATSLKNSGLAASMMDAINKAKSILGYSNKGVKIRVEEPKEKRKEKVDKIIKEVDEEIEEKHQKETLLRKKIKRKLSREKIIYLLAFFEKLLSPIHQKLQIKGVQLPQIKLLLVN